MHTTNKYLSSTCWLLQADGLIFPLPQPATRILSRCYCAAASGFIREFQGGIIKQTSLYMITVN